MSFKAIVYTSTHCPYCRAVKEYFRRLGVPFVEKNVEHNPKYAIELEKKTHLLSVPVILLKGRTIIGFDKPKIDRILGI